MLTEVSKIFVRFSSYVLLTSWIRLSSSSGLSDLQSDDVESEEDPLDPENLISELFKITLLMKSFLCLLTQTFLHIFYIFLGTPPAEPKAKRTRRSYAREQTNMLSMFREQLANANQIKEQEL